MLDKVPHDKVLARKELLQMNITHTKNELVDCELMLELLELKKSKITGKTDGINLNSIIRKNQREKERLVEDIALLEQMLKS